MEKEELRKVRRKNAKIYPIYKMFAYDLLFYYSIEFLFLTITKKVTASEVLALSGFYLICKVIMQIPAVTIVDMIGKRKSLIIGNALVATGVLLVITIPGILGIVIADISYSLGFVIKYIAETTMLYDSVSTKGGEGLYSKLETKGSKWYYILDGVASLTAGYLFVINNYLPMIICFTMSVIATLISFRFTDIYKVNTTKKRKNLKNTLKEYSVDLKKVGKFVLNSNRMKAFILFQIVFYSLIRITMTYRSDLLVTLGIAEEQYSMIFAILTLISGISLSLKTVIEKKFKKRTLTAISLAYVFACIIIGGVSVKFHSIAIMPIVLTMYAIQIIISSMWYIIEAKYVKNFTDEKNRSNNSYMWVSWKYHVFHV